MLRFRLKRWLWIALTAVIVLGAAAAITGKIMLGGCRSIKTSIVQRSTYSGSPMATPVEDWPQWRGPRGDGVSRESLPDQWPADGLPVLWSAEVGLGYASPVAADGVVYLFSLNNGNETLTAFDANSGRILWSRPGSGGWVGGFPGTRATPVVAGDRIFTFGGMGDLNCRRRADGEQIWHVNVLSTTGAQGLGWGCCSNPLVDDGRVYVQAGKGGSIAVAVDAADGSIRWKSQATGLAGYAAPIVTDVEGRRQLVIFAGDSVVGMDPADGSTLWQIPWKTGNDINAATPVARDGRVFITSNYGKGCAMLRLRANGAEILWQNKNVQCRFQPPILHGEMILANSEGSLRGVEWNTGTPQWTASGIKMGIGGSILLSGETLLAMADDGTASLVDVSGGSWRLRSQWRAVKEKEVWVSPLLFAGRMYLKTTRQLVCYDLRAGAPTTRAAREGEDGSQLIDGGSRSSPVPEKRRLWVPLAEAGMLPSALTA